MLVGEKNPAIVLQSETNNGSAAYASIAQMSDISTRETDLAA